jgi:hypothetical protein
MAAAARTRDVEPRRAGEHRGPDRRRPQHTAKGKLFIPALDDGFDLSARSPAGGAPQGCGLDVETPRSHRR